MPGMSDSTPEPAGSTRPDADALTGTAGPGPTSPTPEAQAGFSFKATVVWSAALMAVLAGILLAVGQGREHLLENPEQYLDRVLGHDLDAAEASQHMPRWQRLLNLWDISQPTGALTEAIQIYQHFQASRVLKHDERTERTLAILLAEAGRLKEAETAIKQLSQEDEGSFVRAFRAAYLSREAVEPRVGSDTALRDVNPQWARDKLQWHLAVRAGNQLAAIRIEERLQTRGRRLQLRMTAISIVNLLVIGSGLVAIGRWVLRGSRSPQLGDGVTVSPWTAGHGYAWLVRTAGMGLIIAGGMAWLSQSVPIVSGFATLLASVPMFWLAKQHHLLPLGSGWTECFGLRLGCDKLRSLARVTLATLALTILGEAGVAALTDHLATDSLVESIPEELLFDPPGDLLLSCLDAVVWAPLIEEIAFRGLLYTTLRRRLPVLAAAALSSVIFGAVHGYSLQGFLVICWSGFLWALVYERSRTLWPGIICHAVSNALAIASPILVYRW
jgi:uncharacterized protein